MLELAMLPHWRDIKCIDSVLLAVGQTAYSTVCHMKLKLNA